MELDLRYSLYTADGSVRVVFGNGEEATADPDWIGYLDPEQGITGLLDGPDIRLTPGVFAQTDLVKIGPGWRSVRSGTIQGQLDPNAATGTLEAYAERLRLLTHIATRTNAVLDWVPSEPALHRIPRQIIVRSSGRADIRGRRPKTFLLTLVSASSRVLSSELFSFTSDDVAGDLFWQVENKGSVGTFPTLEIFGPLVSPQIKHIDVLGNESFIQLQKLDETDTPVEVVAADERLIINTEWRTVTRIDASGAQTNAYDLVVFEGTTWFALAPGLNTFIITQPAELLAVGGHVVTRWRHAWP